MAGVPFPFPFPSFSLSSPPPLLAAARKAVVYGMVSCSKPLHTATREKA